ncbi:MAG: HAD family hydrolase [Gammaproteobacteria bacterium]|jgi:5-amino-6-(5-phospho-D-ribitylamino)uracil phosphatase|nr:HAD family hydrolase [Gammaproteobacteria bacterium]
MDLVVFDLDGTLLDARSKISPFTRRTLERLSEKEILFTVATGRTRHGALDVLKGHPFVLPQIYKNGVIVWDPVTEQYRDFNALTIDGIRPLLRDMIEIGVSPFLFTLEPGDVHAIYHPPLQNETERQLAADFATRSMVKLYPLSKFPDGALITNVSALGEPNRIDKVEQQVTQERSLVAYSGVALEGAQLKWIDIHDSQASKGTAVEKLKGQLGVDNLLVFGDSDNDLSMFTIADEAYALSNAKAAVKEVATSIIGHHDEDAVAKFLCQRFELGMP